MFTFRPNRDTCPQRKLGLCVRLRKRAQQKRSGQGFCTNGRTTSTEESTTVNLNHRSVLTLANNNYKTKQARSVISLPYQTDQSLYFLLNSVPTWSNSCLAKIAQRIS